MRTIEVSEAKLRWSSLLDSIEQGESFVITRHGAPVARMVPDQKVVHQGDVKLPKRRKTQPKHIKTGRDNL